MKEGPHNSLPVHQIWISADATSKPQDTKETQSVRSVAGEGYRLWLQDDIRQVISESYPKDVRWAYEKLRPFSYRSDLARVILTHKFGGYYLDLSVFKPTLVPPGENEFVGFRDLNNEHTSWKVATSYFYAAPGSIINECCIEQIVANCHREYYGKDPHFPTGPSVLGRAIAQFGCDLPVRMGSYVWLKRRRNKFLMPGFGIVGRGKVGGQFRGGQSGIPGGNNYNVMWRERTVYNPSVDETSFA